MSNKDKQGRADIGPAEMHLLQLLANPPKRQCGLFGPESAVGPIILLIALMLYWNFVVFPAFHHGQTCAEWLIKWAFGI